METRKRAYNWYTVYTRVNQEKKIYNHLKELRIDCYLPLKRIQRQRSDRKVWIEEPWFRCYLFVYISNLEYFDVLNIQGAVNYVRFEGRPYLMSDEQMTNIKTMINQREREVIVSRENLEKGQNAKVLYGPFKDMEGEVIKICNNYRIVIRIDTLGCNLYANIAKDEIVITDNVISALV